MFRIWQQMTCRSFWECIGGGHTIDEANACLIRNMRMTADASIGWHARNPDYAMSISQEPESHTYPDARKPSALPRRYNLSTIVDVIAEARKLNEGRE